LIIFPFVHISPSIPNASPLNRSAISIVNPVTKSPNGQAAENLKMKSAVVHPFDATESVLSAWPWPKRIWRKAVSLVFCFPDSGLFGLTPLRKHILICGYPRSGSTMLQLMLEHAYPGARRFERETRGYRAAMLKFRNHALLVSKQPGDICKLHRLKNHYTGKTARLRPIIMVRDPRDVLTSHHAGQPQKEYFLPIQKWGRYDRYVRANQNSNDVLLLKYEDLVRDVAGTQVRLEAFIGEPMAKSIGAFHTDVSSSFQNLPALNGLRPVDSQGLGRWRDAKHAARLAEVLAVRPDFPQRLIELGYERDDSWTQAYRCKAA
jgi:hypothetical protein